MILDSEKQRQVLLQLIQGATIPGVAIDEAFHLKQAIASAKVDAGAGARREKEKPLAGGPKSE